MASIFTYDPDPPKVSSPWIPPADPAKDTATNPLTKGNTNAKHDLLSNYGVTKLEAEPQEGPTEYKLHLLLRPRRAFSYMSTRIQGINSNSGTVKAEASAVATPGAAAVPPQPRQQRLQHLTTQLLWRMQQSSPYHAARSKELVVPRLLDYSADFNSKIQLAPLIPGLEESGGALYEIGVSDDGTLVGLTKDEMNESLATLRIMAASLGCVVEVMRMVIVGECEWLEAVDLVDDRDTAVRQITKRDKLWVAEAMVTPSFRPVENFELHAKNEQPGSAAGEREDRTALAAPSRGKSTASQLRVTLTGPTTSGKSSLLGTLSTGTLDNGRGKSRLSLLKHRHEMVSGVTSSIAQELVGYKDGTILNYSMPDIESWIDIHDQAQDGRLLFVSDSGGHPRYRRTVLRGLMNWAPHWSILCIAADDSEHNAAAYSLTSHHNNTVDVPSVDLVKAHLTLSLKLDVPVAVVVTKMDLASKIGLQKTLVKVLSAVKEAGRVPKILQPDQTEHKNLTEIPTADRAKVMPVVEAMKDANSLTRIVPIVLTSAVTGTGIGLVHALFEGLPMPPPPTSHDFVGAVLNPEQPKSLFHIDDIYSLPIPQGSLGTSSNGQNGVIVSGHIRFGSLTVGETIVVGPFPSEDDDGKVSDPEDRPSPSSFGLSISHPASAELARIAMKNAISASEITGEWLKAEVVSIRNLRLPVRVLEAGQAGSVGLVLDLGSEGSLRDMPRIRRGMVLAIPSKHMLETGLSLQAASGFTAILKEFDTKSVAVGTFVNVYVASIRAAARIVRIQGEADGLEPGNTATDELGVFSLNEDMETLEAREAETSGAVEITLELLHTREWIEMGSRVVILEGGTRDRSGLEGYVGKVVEIID